MFPAPQLLDLFRVIDRGNTGRISFRSMQMYVNKYGGQTLNADELSSIFTDFKPGSDNLISQSEVGSMHLGEQQGHTSPLPCAMQLPAVLGRCVP